MVRSFSLISLLIAYTVIKSENSVNTSILCQSSLVAQVTMSQLQHPLVTRASLPFLRRTRFTWAWIIWGSYTKKKKKKPLIRNWHYLKFIIFRKIDIFLIMFFLTSMWVSLFTSSLMSLGDVFEFYLCKSCCLMHIYFIAILNEILVYNFSTG